MAGKDKNTPFPTFFCPIPIHCLLIGSLMLCSCQAPPPISKSLRRHVDGRPASGMEGASRVRPFHRRLALAPCLCTFFAVTCLFSCFPLFPFFLLGFPLFILSLYIAQTIKPFEKALHDLFSRPSRRLFPSVLFASSAPSKFSLSPNDDAKEPHLKAHSGRVRMWKRPFGKTVWAELSPVTGRRQKRGAYMRSPCYCKDTI